MDPFILNESLVRVNKTDLWITYFASKMKNHFSENIKRTLGLKLILSKKKIWSHLYITR